MDSCAFPVPDKYIRWDVNETDELPTVQGYTNPGPTTNLRGMEANTAFSKGSTTQIPAISADRHEDM